MPQKNFDVSRETTANIMNNLRQNSNLRGSGLSDPVTDQGNAASSSNGKWKGNNINQRTVVEEDGAIMDLGISKPTSSLGCDKLLDDRDQETGLDEPLLNHPMGTDTDTGKQSQAKENDAASNVTQAPNNQESDTINGMKKQAPFLPQWTDEQLDELFAFD